ncbi:DUF2892 domain-containing protein (plasmid) [Streptomyces sp. NBC_00637]|uniref:YgaP-like transmembrane domain n=1 Tax=Streptomyces sp. NBC_00637 TaxID=2903667 RepID=UPI002F917E04
MTRLILIAVAGAMAALFFLPYVLSTSRHRHPAPTRGGRGSPAAPAGAVTTDLDAQVRRARAEVVRLRGLQGRSAAPPAPGGVKPSAVAVTGWRRYLPVNMSRPEQVVRVAAGVAIAVIAVLVLPGVGGGWGVGLAVVSGLAVVDLVVSGLIAHCPLHRFMRMPWEPRDQNAEMWRHRAPRARASAGKGAS